MSWQFQHCTVCQDDSQKVPSSPCQFGRPEESPHPLFRLGVIDSRPDHAYEILRRRRWSSVWGSIHTKSRTRLVTQQDFYISFEKRNFRFLSHIVETLRLYFSTYQHKNRNHQSQTGTSTIQHMSLPQHHLFCFSLGGDPRQDMVDWEALLLCTETHCCFFFCQSPFLSLSSLYCLRFLHFFHLNNNTFHNWEYLCPSLPSRFKTLHTVALKTSESTTFTYTHCRSSLRASWFRCCSIGCICYLHKQCAQLSAARSLFLGKFPPFFEYFAINHSHYQPERGWDGSAGPEALLIFVESFISASFDWIRSAKS